jgi:hypothetical protein
MYIYMITKEEIIIKNRNKLLRNFFTNSQINLINRSLIERPQSNTVDYVSLSKIKQKLKAMNNLILDTELFELTNRVKK